MLQENQRKYWYKSFRLKKKFRLEGIYPKEDKFENNIDNLYFKNYKNKFHTFKSSKFLYDNNNKTKTRPILVFEVLSQASQNSNLLLLKIFLKWNITIRRKNSIFIEI